MTLLIVGDGNDLTSTYLRHCAGKRGYDVRVLAEDSYGFDWHFVFDDVQSDPLCMVTDTIYFKDGTELPCSHVAGAFLRSSPRPNLPSDIEAEPLLAETYGRERRAAIYALIRRLKVPVANPPGCGHSNGSKPLQMKELVEAGFSVPAWVASNDGTALSEFVTRQSQGAIVKSCSGMRSEVQRWTPSYLERLSNGSPPIVAQAYISGHDVRLHTVGRRAFATAVDSTEAVDYRFAESPGQYRACASPPDINELCVRYATQCGLLIAGFDFRVGSDGRWWCLECNPMPTFLPYEMETGQRIADALLDEFYLKAA